MDFPVLEERFSCTLDMFENIGNESFDRSSAVSFLKQKSEQRSLTSQTPLSNTMTSEFSTSIQTGKKLERLFL
jgi:hypothetical protein